LATYLADVYLGNNGNQPIVGVSEASTVYFNQDVNALLPAEVALIAGIIRGPSFYSIQKSPKSATTRRNTVLNQMFTTGVISKSQYDESINTSLPSPAE